MDQSRRAVEAYWRSRMVDGVTADEDKIAPVYKLEEICELLRTSPAGIVKEVSEYILKRLDHKSPIVKQKALRLVKYAVGKSGVEFRREMQRHSGVMRQLVHYKGQQDPLKGDALNKAVRETAQEAISAMFASEDNKVVVPADNLNKRIQGFGNTNYEMPSEEKKSFLSEVVGLGSASIIQGLTNIASAHSMKKNDVGSYKSPTLRRSLTNEIDSREKYVVNEHYGESWTSSVVSKNAGSGTWSQDSRANMASSVAYEDSGSSQKGVKSREDRLLETIVSSGGVRLQPTRDALQAFLVEAAKLDAVAMSHAIESKLQSHLWQVRMKAICVLEAILRKSDNDHFSVIASYFIENRDLVVKCSELPQSSLREKANKVLFLLDGDNASEVGYTRESSEAKTAPVPVQMPDLIDTGDLNDYESESSNQHQVDQGIGDLTSGSIVDDLFGAASIADQSSPSQVNSNDPFADVSFHATEDKESDLFSGLTVEDKKLNRGLDNPISSSSPFLDIFSDSLSPPETKTNENNVDNLMADLSLNGGTQENKQHVSPGGAFPVSSFLDGSNQPTELPFAGALNPMMGSNAFPTLAQYSMPPNIMFNQVFPTNQMDYAAMGAYIAQQQLLFQNLGTLNPGFAHAAGNVNEGSYGSPLPDIFQLSSNPIQMPAAMSASSKKEETKAFDFISDHLSAARDSKRVT
ncbi:ENTH/VHS domain-containing protein [Dioscorea alata]|uniref:ENTH/VHS domain-containing protein n=1 Tax=Dioscorea alata TaxID=55571 RepID=A0ACB7UBY0_DIOAL|nr:ENTH/VHS domain-containing protein [Dioscorea alata]